MDSLPAFPRNAVPTDTEAFLTSEIETRSGEPSPYDRPITGIYNLFKKLSFTILREQKIFNLVSYSGVYGDI